MGCRLVRLVAFAVVAVGCSDAGDLDRPEGVPPGFIVWTEPILDGLDAVVGGTVSISAAGCVSVQSSPDSAAEPVIWPFRTTFDGMIIRTTDGVEIKDGDSIWGSGGEVEYEHEYYLANTTLGSDLDAMLQCGEIDGLRIPAFNPTQPIELRTG